VELQRKDWEGFYKMRLSNDETKFLNQWKYVEVARYVPSLDRVIRDKAGDNPIFYDMKNIDEYRKLHNNTGLYTSVWHYNSKDIDNCSRLGSLYFDLDNENINKCHKEVIFLYNYLINLIPEESVLVYFTGKKGFHIECEAVALGINPTNELPKMFRYIASKIKEKYLIESLDFAVYDMRRMWRLPGSRHQSTGLYKNLIPKEILNSSMDSIVSYCSIERKNVVQEQVFSLSANEWYRQFTYQMEEEKTKPKDFLESFNKYGSSKLKAFNEKQKSFEKENLWKNCPATKRLHEQAINNKELEHEARLFLCSILTYNVDSIKYLHEILSSCDDYNFEKSTGHINDWIRRRELGIGGRPYTCDRANAVGVGCGNCALEKRNKWVKIGDKLFETSEQSSPSPVRFAYKTIKDSNAKR